MAHRLVTVALAMSEQLDWALYYQARGWSVVPVRPREKLPAIPWAQLETAPASETQVREWWTGEHAKCGIGLIQGAVAGTFVVDVDDNEFDGKHGSEVLRTLESKHGPLPATMASKTGSGGRHLFFRHPGPAVRVKTRKNIGGMGLDVRGDGGFVVAAPSLHACGQIYAWDPDAFPGEVDPAEAPEWLIALVSDGPAMAEAFDTEVVTSAFGRIADGRETYMRDTALACLVELVGENGTTPTAQELFDAAWPQYRRRVDFSRGGRGPDEMFQKCRYTVDRFTRGEIDGIRTLEEAVARYRARSGGNAPSAASAEPAGDDLGSAEGDEPFSAEGDEPFSAAELAGEPPAREWLVPEWLPKQTVTALYGDGGVGKTLVAQQLGTAMSLGIPWLGMAVPQGRVLAMTCEDDRNELHRRQAWINQSMGVALSAQLVDLILWPRVGHENVLVHFDPSGVAKTTAFYDRLRRVLDRIRPGLLIVDPAADVYGGNENNRVQVNYFIKAMLGHLVVEYACTVLLLAHPSMAGLASGQGTGGSTAWNNAVRSRWYLSRVEGGVSEQRVLTRKKANYASAGDDQQIDLIWEGGALTVPRSQDALDKLELRSAKRAVLDAVEQAWNDGKPFTTTQGGRPYRSNLAKAARLDGVQAVRAFEELRGDGHIGVSENHKVRGFMVVDRPEWAK